MLEGRRQLRRSPRRCGNGRSGCCKLCCQTLCSGVLCGETLRCQAVCREGLRCETLCGETLRCQAMCGKALRRETLTSLRVLPKWPAVSGPTAGHDVLKLEQYDTN
jgi:hypothetical protein